MEKLKQNNMKQEMVLARLQQKLRTCCDDNMDVIIWQDDHVLLII
jgi:hypothetical protein